MKKKQELNVENLQDVKMDMLVRERSPDVENNNYHFSLALYLEVKLSALGLRKELAALEIKKHMELFMKVVKQVKELSLPHRELADVLTKYGFYSGHVTVILIADLLVEWVESGGRVRSVDRCLRREAKKEDGPIKDFDSPESGTDDEDDHKQSIPVEIMKMEEGFPKMALVMAFYLHNEGELDEQISKDLARAMVGVWINYGFTYQQMWEVYQLKDEEDVRVGIFDLMLNKKIDEGFLKPKSFVFCDLIKLTMIYFKNNC